MMFRTQSLTIGNCLVCSLEGRLDANTSTRADQELIRVAEGLIDPRIVLDLSSLSYCSSAGLRVFLLAAKRMKAANGTIALCSLQPPVKEVFSISGFDSMFSVYENQSAAVQALSS